MVSRFGREVALAFHGKINEPAVVCDGYSAEAGAASGDDGNGVVRSHRQRRPRGLRLSAPSHRLLRSGSLLASASEPVTSNLDILIHNRGNDRHRSFNLKAIGQVPVALLLLMPGLVA